MLSSSSMTRMLAAMESRSRCWWPDSNGRPTDYESVALPAELHQRGRGLYDTGPSLTTRPTACDPAGGQAPGDAARDTRGRTPDTTGRLPARPAAAARRRARHRVVR